ncbi:protein HAPLESS 2 [Coffea eugenioides]|uniref:protein HAPLESS 2 n=1 Tax=Coffea eugenioides TaxID=49369 RepID=UPI000F606D70|nr:protein HAPLESS 2 [Coffea eugenioides]
MGNVVGSVLGGVSEVLGKLLGHPLDFLSGKSCSSKCGPTWDLTCYIENFCIAQLLKLGLVVVLLYFVLVFFYLSYKLGICQCICHIICRSIWACCATWFSVLEFCCTFLCSKLDKHNRRRRRRRRDIEASAITSEDDLNDDEDDHGGRFTNQATKHISKRRKLLSGQKRHYREEHMRRALRPNSHRVHVGVSEESFRSKRRNSSKYHDHVNPVDHIRVTRTSKFAQKRGSFKGSMRH